MTSIQKHLSTFQLITDQTFWLSVYRMNRNDWEEDRVDIWNEDDISNKTYSMLRATFETLSNAGQLRIKRFCGYKGLGDEIEISHTIQILDHDQKVVYTLVGVMDDKDYLTHFRNVLEKGVFQRSYYGWDEEEDDTLDTELYVPLHLPNIPEFCYENGVALNLKTYFKSSAYNYALSRVNIRSKYVTDVCMTKECREEKIRSHTIDQCKKLKEELMINRWNPKRVEFLLELGYNIEDM